MKRGIAFIFVLNLMFNCNEIAAQTHKNEKDTARFYRNIEEFSNRHKITKSAYQLVFSEWSNRTAESTMPQKKKKLLKSHRSFEGKIIRNIYITTLDPFGNSIVDTASTSHKYFSKAGNSLHIKSKQATIRNLLLIRPNQTFDSLLVMESERLVRSQPYIHDVNFSFFNVSKNSDSLDVFIRVLDNWSIFSKIEGSPIKPTLNLNEKNFLGLGHSSNSNLTRYHPANDYSYNSSYYIPNIRNTYINSTLSYFADRYRNYSTNLSIDRPFYSSFAKWAAGASLSRQFRVDSMTVSDSLVILQNFKINVQDYWAGYAFKIYKGKSQESRTTNLIASVRLLKIGYLEKLDEKYDTAHIYSDENFYLAAIGLSTRKYAQERYIFKYGVIEDVPVGKVVSLTIGYQQKTYEGRFYAKTQFSYNKYFSWGYLSSNLEFGSYFQSANIEQGVLKIGVNYFTNLFEIGNWKIRQFGKSHLSLGFNRLSTETLSINDGFGIDGFNSEGLSGTKRFVISLQTQSYAPWNLIGFRFGPYLSYSFGMLSTDKMGFANSVAYQQISLGILIKNDYLIINTFQFSVSFFPIIPGIGANVFKTNSFKTNDFGFKDFGIGKPETIGFQ